MENNFLEIANKQLIDQMKEIKAMAMQKQIEISINHNELNFDVYKRQAKEDEYIRVIFDGKDYNKGEVYKVLHIWENREHVTVAKPKHNQYGIIDCYEIYVVMGILHKDYEVICPYTTIKFSNEMFE